jgi:hypothetical protein
MAAKLVRAPNSHILIVAGLALLLLGAVGVERAVLNTHHYRVPVMLLAEGAVVNAVFGIALLYVAIRRSQFAGVTAVIIATFIAFAVVSQMVVSLAVWRPPHVTWWTAINLAIAGAIAWPSVFPWNWSANKPALIWMAATFGTLTFFFATLAILVRL